MKSISGRAWKETTWDLEGISSRRTAERGTELDLTI